MLPRHPYESCYVGGDRMMISQAPGYFQTLVQSRQSDVMPDYDYTQRYSESLAPRMVTVTPHAIISPANEPIEAGSIPSRRRRSESESTRTSATGAPSSKRSHVTWENMTDDEREEAQRQRRKEQAFKTALCDAYKKTGACSYGDACRFAHGENELRLPAQPRGKAHPKYKTQLCDKYSANGHCPYGPRCQFIHKLKKGLPLLDYEVMLSQGKISPAREEEITNDDNGGFRRNGGHHSPRRNRGHGKRLHFENYMEDDDLANEGGVYPKMQVINIERALQVSENNYQRYDGNARGRRDNRRSLGNSNIGNMDPRRNGFDTGPGLSSKSSSMQSLVFRGAAEPVREADMYERVGAVSKGLQQPDLSLIPEENEDTTHDISLGYGKQKKAQQNHWSDMIFGKKMEAIKEEDKENQYTADSSSADGSGNTEAELLVQSCDEELLAQGLYDNKYPDVSLDLLKQWKPLK